MKKKKKKYCLQLVIYSLRHRKCGVRGFIYERASEGF